jgi:hypothetical protein
VHYVLFKGLGKGSLGLNKGWAGLKKVDLCLENRKMTFLWKRPGIKKVTLAAGLLPLFDLFLLI